MNKRIYKNIIEKELDYKILVCEEAILAMKDCGYIPVGVAPEDTSIGRYAYAESSYGVYCDELTDELEYGEFYYSGEYFAPLKDTPSIELLETKLANYREEKSIREKISKLKKERIDVLRSISTTLHQYYKLYNKDSTHMLKLK